MGLIDQYIANIAAAQRQEQAHVTSGAGRHAIRDESALDRWMDTIGGEQLHEAGRRKKRGAKQQTSGLKGAALGYILPMVAKKIFPQLQMADWAWKATQAALAYGGYKIGAGQVPYNYRKPTAQAPQTTFAQPKYEDILGDIDRLNIQGKTMEALHTASGEQMAQQIGMYLMPWTDIAGIGMPSTTAGAPGSHGAQMGAWQGKQSASHDPLQGLYNLFGKG